MALKRIDANTMDVTYKKDGKTVTTARTSISGDGKVMTTTAKFDTAAVGFPGLCSALRCGYARVLRFGRIQLPCADFILCAQSGRSCDKRRQSCNDECDSHRNPPVSW